MEKFGLLYNLQQSWNPKQAITLKHIITYITLRAYINPKGIIGMPITGHHIWSRAYEHDREGFYIQVLRLVYRENDYMVQ